MWDFKFNPHSTEMEYFEKYNTDNQEITKLFQGT